MIETYFIKAGYQHKDKALTAQAEGAEYWTPHRLLSSRYYQYHVYTYARSLIQKFNLQSCVDVGCGSGYKLMQIIAPTGVRTMGIDQPYIIDRAKQVYPSGEWQKADFEKPVTELATKFDMILSVDVIEHLLNPDELLQYVKSLAHPDSYILISTPERDIMSGSSNDAAVNKEHIREWNQAEFRSYLESRSLEVTSIVLLPGLRFHLSRRYLSYLKHHWRKPNYNMLAVCRLHTT